MSLGGLQTIQLCVTIAASSSIILVLCYSSFLFVKNTRKLKKIDD